MKNKMKQTQQRKKELEETKNRTKETDRDGALVSGEALYSIISQYIHFIYKNATNNFF